MVGNVLPEIVETIGTGFDPVAAIRNAPNGENISLVVSSKHTCTKQAKTLPSEDEGHETKIGGGIPRNHDTIRVTNEGSFPEKVLEGTILVPFQVKSVSSNELLSVTCA